MRIIHGRAFFPRASSLFFCTHPCSSCMYAIFFRSETLASSCDHGLATSQYCEIGITITHITAPVIAPHYRPGRRDRAMRVTNTGRHITATFSREPRRGGPTTSNHNTGRHGAASTLYEYDGDALPGGQGPEHAASFNPPVFPYVPAGQNTAIPC